MRDRATSAGSELALRTLDLPCGGRNGTIQILFPVPAAALFPLKRPPDSFIDTLPEVLKALTMEAADEETPLIHYLTLQDEDSQNSSDGTVDVNKKPALKRNTGNWRACYLILGAEINESLAFSGIQKNLVTYLTSVLHESNVDAAKNVSTWLGSCFFTPLIGAFLADTYWGRYWTVVIFISIQAIGTIALTVSAWLPLLMDSSFNGGSIHRSSVYLGLYLIAVGSGGIKPCTSALGADQFDGADPAERVNKGSFFNWFFFSINLGSLLSSTVLVWVQDNVGWGVGFAIPMALTVLVAGREVYRHKKLEGSPLTRVSQVVVAAVRNHNLTLPEDSSALHEMPEANCKTAHTCQLRFFDKAAIVAPPQSSDEKGVTCCSGCSPCGHRWHGHGQPRRPVRRAAGLPRHLPHHQHRRRHPHLRRRAGAAGPAATGDARGLSQLRRLGVGLALSVAAMAYAALVEARRLAAAATPMSIAWQAPSFALIGAAEVFTTSGLLEFFYDQSPGGMKSMGTSLAHLAIAAGSYLNSAVLGAVAWATARGGAPGWIPDNLDEGHLDYFFWLMAALSVVNLLHFVHCSGRYRGNKAGS
ncbi:unnamed protein product [Urochloa decumbens]|uniref:Uncharacterized protein n=1 Tax=Urochloa decumbens TaxID=240449 RepID=A0ABC8ZBI2_9POAL